MVVFGSCLQFDGRAVAISVALQLLRAIVVPLAPVVVVVSGTVAFQHLSKLLQVVLIKGDELSGSVVTLIVDRYDFQPERRSGNIDVCAFLVLRIIFWLRLCAGIDRKAGVTHIGIFVYVNSPKGSFDVNVLVAAFFVFLDVDAARRQRK